MNKRRHKLNLNKWIEPHSCEYLQAPSRKQKTGWESETRTENKIN